MTAFHGTIQGLGGGKVYPPKWSEIGYSETPSEIISAFNYAKNIQTNWTVGQASQWNQDKKLFFFPVVDMTSRRDFYGYFNESNLMHFPSTTIGDNSNNNGSCVNMFRKTFIEEITLNSTTATQKFNTENMFSECKNLKKAVLNLKSYQSNGMFYECRDLTAVYGLDTSEVVNMSNMFENCRSLTIAPDIDTSSAQNMYRMYKDCILLESVPSGNFNLQTVKDFGQMFVGDYNLKNIPIIDFTSATNLNGMFQSTGSNLTETSRDNLLKSLTSATSYTGTKTLAQLGFNSSMYSASSWQALTSYSTFIYAGWSIGYS